MAEHTKFEMLELASGEVVLRSVGDDEGYLLKLAFNQTVASSLGDRKLDICREMVVAGIEAAQSLDERLVSFVSSDDLDEESREQLLNDFSEQRETDLAQTRILH